jgi:hypothetical protein
MGVDIAFSQALFMGIYIPFSSVRKLYPTARDSLFPVVGESFLGSGLAAGRGSPWVGGKMKKLVGEM